MWVIASSLATGVEAWNSGGERLLAATWKQCQHTNLTELDTMLKNINFAHQLQGKVMHMKTDSLCVYHWVLNTLIRKAWVCTKAASEILIRRQLSTLKVLVKEYELTVAVTLVISTQNMADQLTRVPQQWFNMMKRDPGHWLVLKKDPAWKRLKSL